MIVMRELRVLLIASALAMPGVALHAQPSKGPPNALQGFSQNRDQPVHIEAATLEVRDKEKVATFSGNVRVKQGDTGMRCKSLVVFYEQDGTDGKATDDKSNSPAKTADKTADKAPEKGKPMQSATPGPGGNQKIKRLEARGGVVVTQKEQTATGELGIFDMAANTVTLSGGVTMTTGPNVLRGDRLVVDLTSGVSRVESGKNGEGRVQGLFLPSSGDALNLKPGGEKKPAQPGTGAKAQQPMPLR
jgi:lipopolysaccharide export system protein LptA